MFLILPTDSHDNMSGEKQIKNILKFGLWLHLGLQGKT